MTHNYIWSALCRTLYLFAIGRSRDGSYLLLFPEWFDLVLFSVCSATTSFSIILSSLSIMASSILPYSPISFRIVVSDLSFSLTVGMWVSWVRLRAVILTHSVITMWINWISYTLISYWFRILDWSRLHNRGLNFLFEILPIVGTVRARVK